MLRYHTTLGTGLTLCLVASTHAAIIGVDLRDGASDFTDTNDISSGGIFWNGISAQSTAANALDDSTTAASGFKVQITNGFGFGRNGSPTPSAVINSAGYRWPTSVQTEGGSENFSGTRNGFAVLRFTVPASSGLTNWSITALGGDSSFLSWGINVGGTYAGSSSVTPSFTGGVTAMSSTTGLSTLSVSNISPTLVGSDYVVDLQFATMSTQTSNAATLRAVVINAVIPEPSSVALLGLASVFAGRRRRMA